MDALHRHNLNVIAAHAPGHRAGGGEPAPLRCARCGNEADDVRAESVVIDGDGVRWSPLCERCEEALMRTVSEEI